jgi:MFS family permease
VLTWLGLGILLPLGIAYLNECLPRRSRNRLSVLGASGFSLGGIIAELVGIFVAPALGWHSMFLLGGFTIVLAVPIPSSCPNPRNGSPPMAAAGRRSSSSAG